jgi:hypothetical protein
MKKTVFILLIKILLQNGGMAQNLAVKTWVVPQKENISLLKKQLPVNNKPAAIFTSLKATPETAPLLVFNSHPLLNAGNLIKKPMQFFAEFSFPDLMESRINSLKSGLINTYDDNVTELFKDAPSLFKIRCMMAF